MLASRSLSIRSKGAPGICNSSIAAGQKATLVRNPVNLKRKSNDYGGAVLRKDLLLLFVIARRQGPQQATFEYGSSYSVSA